MSTMQLELKQHLESNQKLRNAGASNDDIVAAAASYQAAALGNLDETLNRIESVLANINEQLINIEVNVRGSG